MKEANNLDEIDDSLSFLVTIYQKEWFDDKWYGDIYRFLEALSFNKHHDASMRKRI
jgi:hypothetical protein